MYLFSFVLIFLLGTIIGSFLNVVIYRCNTGKSIAKGRSICMSCNHTLRFYELIPVFSFIFQKGKCRRCSSSISFQYPIVEMITGFVFVLLAFYFLPFLWFSVPLYIVNLSLFSVLFCFLIIICAYDIRHKIIPDVFSYSFAGIAFVTLFINHTALGSMFVLPGVEAILAGPLCALPFYLLWKISGGRWMGLGDAKLMLGIGWMLGLGSGFVALVFSFWIGAVFGLLLMLYKGRSTTLKTEIPFAPFLIISTTIVFFCSISLLSFILFFQRLY